MARLKNKEFQERFDNLVRKAWIDAAFKQRLLDDPMAVLREEGWTIPAGKQIRVVENTTETLYLTLPPTPPVAELDLPTAQVDSLIGVENAGTHVTACSSCDTYGCSKAGCDTNLGCTRVACGLFKSKNARLAGMKK